MSDNIKSDYVEFESEDGEVVKFQVIEQTTIAGKNYLLVAESDEEESDAYILEEMNGDDDSRVYRMVDDDVELESMMKVFAELLDDVDIQM